jgi:hypothetical protein
MAKVMCKKCEGTGSFDDNVCRDCGGSGYQEIIKTTRNIYTVITVHENCKHCTYRQNNRCLIFDDIISNRPLQECQDSEEVEE